MVRFAGVIVLVSCLATAIVAQLPWVIGPDAAAVAQSVTSGGSAFVTGLSSIGALLGLALLFNAIPTPVGGISTGMAVLAAVAVLLTISAAGNTVTLTVSGDGPNFAGPAPYAAGVGIVSWFIASIGAILAATDRRGVVAADAASESGVGRL